MMKPRFLTLAGVVLFAVLWRIVPHPWNFTPVAAMALFAGAHFSSRRTAYALPISAMLISNVVLGHLYSTMPFVYGSFVLTVFIGTLLRQRKDAGSVGAAALSSSILFFTITNFGEWLVGGMYPKTAAGLGACFTAAIPFFRNTLVGDLFFTAAFFGGFALLERRFPVLQDPSLASPLRFSPR